MSQMLTAKELQKILDVDRSTVYRMAEDGRLPAIKVGRQWRFPAQKIEDWLSTLEYDLPSVNIKDQPQANIDDFPVECIQMMQNTFAEALGVMIILTDMTGKPITRFSNPCGLFSVLDQNKLLWDKCMTHWQEMADSLSLEPEFVDSYLGLLCTRAYIREGRALRGMVFVGGIAPETWPLENNRIEAIAHDLNVDPQLIFDHVQDVYFLTQQQKEHVLGLVQKIANVVSHILHERHQILTH